MTTENNLPSKVKVDIDGHETGIGLIVLSLVILGIFFYGEPDLHDALINFLMRCVS